MLPARINLVTLGVGDIAVATAFYEKLGWKRSQGGSNDQISFLALDNVVLGLFGRENLAKDMNGEAPGTPAAPGAATLAINLPSEAAVDEAMAAALEAGARLLKKPENVFWGGYSGYFADPDGHPWELAYNPFFPLDGAGMVQLPD
jgi:hypothetical protein